MSDEQRYFLMNQYFFFFSPSYLQRIPHIFIMKISCRPKYLGCIRDIFWHIQNNQIYNLVYPGISISVFVVHFGVHEFTRPSLINLILIFTIAYQLDLVPLFAKTRLLNDKFTYFHNWYTLGSPIQNERHKWMTSFLLSKYEEITRFIFVVSC